MRKHMKMKNSRMQESLMQSTPSLNSRKKDPLPVRPVGNPHEDPRRGEAIRLHRLQQGVHLLQADEGAHEDSHRRETVQRRHL